MPYRLQSIRTMNRSNLRALILALTAGVCSSPVSAQSLSSVQLTDVIKSQGSGNIDLFKDIDAQTLEAFRVDGDGVLTFAVDINEDASGSEKSTSQGVSVQSIVFTVTYDDGQMVQLSSSIVTQQIFTETQAYLAQFPGTSRKPYFTLLGESGSSRITANNVIQDQYDSTIKVMYPQSIYSATGRKATSARLDVVLLRTNESLGDPEAFYDYSAGFEDVALVTRADSDFIDDYEAGRDEAPTVVLTNDPMMVKNWNYFPSATSYFMVGYEDRYPYRGDYDFNDLTVAYQVRIGTNFEGDVLSVGGTAYLLTRGAAFSHDWRLGMDFLGGASGIMSCALSPDPEQPNVSQPCPGVAERFSGSRLDLNVFSDTLSIFQDPWGSVLVNTSMLNVGPYYRSWVLGPRTDFMLDFDQPVLRANLSEAPFDPHLYVRNTKRTVKLIEVDPTFEDDAGYPFGMLLVSNWKPPLESRATGFSYPEFNTFVESEGTSSVEWYLNYLNNQVITIPDVPTWAW